MRILASAVVTLLALLAGAHGAAAQQSDETAVAQAVEAYRKAMLAGDRSQMEALCAAELSYGHSSGRVETKAQLIADVGSGRLAWNFITLTDPSVRIAGNNAIARNIFTGEYVSGGKTTPVKIGVLMVWQKQDGQWKLLARQAYRL